MSRLVPSMALVVSAAAATVLACGDKFLVIGHGARYHAVRATAHPAAIIIYANPTSHVPEATRDLYLESNLRRAGHKPTTVTDGLSLEENLRNGRYDLVIADIADAPAVAASLGSVASRPALLALLWRPRPAELTEARRRFGRVLKAPTSTGALLDVVEEAQSARLRTAASAADRMETH